LSYSKGKRVDINILALRYYLFHLLVYRHSKPFGLYVAETDFCSDKDDGLYEIRGNCSAYYRCANRETYVELCLRDHLFIPERNQCLPPDRAPQQRVEECTSTPRYELIN